MTTTPPTGQQLADRIAAALRAAAYDCDGTCGLDERECDAQHPIQVAVVGHGVVTAVYGDLPDLAAVAAAAVQPELDRLAAELKQARQQTSAIQEFSELDNDGATCPHNVTRQLRSLLARFPAALPGA